MKFSDWCQILLFIAVASAGAIRLRRYASSVFEERVRLLALVETGFYKLAGVDPAREQGWFGYTFAVLAFNAAGFALLYSILRLQDILPANPQGFGAVDGDLALNTAVSFTTNTNWQAIGGETTLTHFTQIAGLNTQNFVLAATGIAVAIAVTRAFARSSARTLGNFWVDLTRGTLYLPMPIAIVVALAFMALGVLHTLDSSFVRRRWRAPSRSSRSDRRRASSRSSSSAPTAAASSTSTRRIRSRTRPTGPTRSSSGRASRSRLRLPLRSGA
ncbi:hypothetical protein GCM10011322_27430 [Salinarimonas ramus]|uniref:Potassium-transporting ATPase subunit KdpA n=1 Tax=Salinarimonas ramus TaxID=690164 RepID=A0A917QA65_9HYPH|nr:potassium-transporting ATPase subunit KdpA [Salinarimonas ramus]GGK38864.1 hypothetical protein GCM10011322_27430 [Salinarimonas ramus]